MKINYLKDEAGTSKFGCCNECGIGSAEGDKMRRLHFNGTSICLCYDCFGKAAKEISREYKKDLDEQARQQASESDYTLWIMAVGGDDDDERIVYQGNDISELEDAIVNNNDEVETSASDKYFELITKKNNYTFNSYREYLKVFRGIR